jgi:hypothetical protein
LNAGFKRPSSNSQEDNTLGSCFVEFQAPDIDKQRIFGYLEQLMKGLGIDPLF